MTRDEAKPEALRRVNAVVESRGGRHPYGIELFSGHPSALGEAFLQLVEEHAKLQAAMGEAFQKEYDALVAKARAVDRDP